MQVSVRVTFDRAIERLDLTKKQANRALVRALNKTATTARAQASREIRDEGYGLKVGDIKGALSVRKAVAALLTAKVRATGRPISLYKYGARQTRNGVTVNVLHGRKLIAHAFIATMPNGHVGVFLRVDSAAHAQAAANGAIKAYAGKRKGAYRHGLPIRELFGPSIPAAFSNDAVMRALEQAIRDRFPTVLAQELRYEGLRH